MQRYSIRTYLERALDRLRLTDPGAALPVVLDGEPMFLQEIHSDFLLVTSQPRRDGSVTLYPIEGRVITLPKT